MFGSWLMLGLWSYAYAYDDPYCAGLTSFLCFVFCFFLMLMLTCEPDLKLDIESDLAEFTVTAWPHDGRVEVTINDLLQWRSRNMVALSCLLTSKGLTGERIPQKFTWQHVTSSKVWHVNFGRSREFASSESSSRWTQPDWPISSYWTQNPIHNVNILGTARLKFWHGAAIFAHGTGDFHSVSGAHFLKFGIRTWKFSHAQNLPCRAQNVTV